MRRTFFTMLLGAALAAGCAPPARGVHPFDGGGGGNGDGGSGGNQAGCSGVEFSGCYTVYAHSDHVLYRIDLNAAKLITIGPFNAPKVNGSEDTITDLAVSPDDHIYVISKTNLYSADPNDGHVTLVGPVTACGTYAVALTFSADGQLYAADFNGAFCKIDVSTNPPNVQQIGSIGSGLAIAGDLVAVADGTMYGTAYRLADGSSSGTANDNLLVKIDPSTGSATQTIGSTGFPKLFGVAFDQGKVFGFTHDGSGDVITIDPQTGQGTLYGTFTDPTGGGGIAFAGAGVNSMVPATIM